MEFSKKSLDKKPSEKLIYSICKHMNINPFTKKVNNKVSKTTNQFINKIIEPDKNRTKKIVESQKNIEDINQLNGLVLLDSEDSYFNCSSLYISDSYQNDGIESLVKKYDKQASFVSALYLEEDSEKEKNEWLKRLICSKCCIFFKTKNGKNYRCHSPYQLACEHFEEK